MLTERKRRFVDVHMKIGNASRAAREAGYSENASNRAGCRLLTDMDVLALIESKRVKRSVHADVTYQNLIAISNVALEEVQKARESAEPDRIRAAIECARRALETVGKAECLFVERVEHVGGDKPIQFEVSLAGLQTEELEQLDAILARAHPVASAN